MNYLQTLTRLTNDEIALELMQTFSEDKLALTITILRAMNSRIARLTYCYHLLSKTTPHSVMGALLVQAAKENK